MYFFAAFGVAEIEGFQVSAFHQSSYFPETIYFFLRSTADFAILDDVCLNVCLHYFYYDRKSKNILNEIIARIRTIAVCIIGKYPTDPNIMVHFLMAFCLSTSFLLSSSNRGLYVKK